MKKIFITTTFPLFASLLFSEAKAIDYSIQNTLNGAFKAQSDSGVYGKGVVFGVIDTGIAPDWIGFNGNIDTAASKCMISACKSSFDDHGHGTFVASEIIGSVNGTTMKGITPEATAFGVKVLNAKGSGTATDVANGIRYAADNGANILNLSLTFLPTTDIVNAINYAASKNVITVFAGGNSNKILLNGATTTGFTDAALRRLMFAGSTNDKMAISSFSNKPGTTGKFTAKDSKASYLYNSLWIMADGENIWGASTYNTSQYGYSYVTQMSGTSMAAPQLAGAAGMLVSRWPFLLNTGNVVTILTKTTQDLGAKGIDGIYGTGFLRIDTAMQPIGALTVPVSGKMVPVTNVQITTSGPVGNLGNLSSALQKAVAYDSYNRDYNVALAAAISPKPATSTSSSAASKVDKKKAKKAKKFTATGEDSWMLSSFENAPVNPSEIQSASPQSSYGLVQDPTQPNQYEWSVGFSNDGNYSGAGQGTGAASMFNDARWNEKTAFASGDSAGAGEVFGLIQNANFSAKAFNITPSSRLSFEMMTTQNMGATDSVNDSSAHGIAMGYTFNPTKKIAVSLTSSILDENNMLLGSTASGPLSLGKSSYTTSFGAGTNIKLGNGYQLGFEASYFTTGASSNNDSLITSISPLSGASFNLALSKEQLFDKNDEISIALRKPLRIYSGTANVAIPVGTDMDGNPIIQNELVSVVPTGNETNFDLGYSLALSDYTQTGFNLSYRNDADNIAGYNDSAVMVTFDFKF